MAVSAGFELFFSHNEQFDDGEFGGYELNFAHQKENSLLAQMAAREKYLID